MKHRIITFSFVLTVGLALACVPLLAHHGSTAYETTKVLTFKDAMVTKVLWANPHVIIVFDVKDSALRWHRIKRQRVRV